VDAGAFGRFQGFAGGGSADGIAVRAMQKAVDASDRIRAFGSVFAKPSVPHFQGSSMKSLLVLVLALVAVLAMPSVSLAEETTLKGRAADAAESIKRGVKDAADATARATREAWKTTKAYLSQDPGEYRNGAVKKLESLGDEVAALGIDAKKVSMADRTYFQTRIRALHEHLEYARAELAKLPDNKDQKDYTSARRHFNRTLETLEDAVDQARSEASNED
jgi:ElaB/YqjD/DUF883 family membrane-anchored ribosome-binding protein